MASRHRKRKAQDYVRLLLLGKTGSGKSTTGNTILGHKKFKSGASFSSVTATCQMKDAVVDGTTVEILDCPGLCDTSQSDADTAVIITKAVVGLHPGPHAVLYVLNNERFTAEDYEAFKKLERLFDKRLFNYLIVVITGGDNYEYDGVSPEDAIKKAPPSLKALLKDCGHRYIVFNNRAQNSSPQVRRLLEMVRGRVSANGDMPHYRCPTYDAIGDQLEKEVRSRIATVEKEMLKKQNAFQSHMKQQKKKMDEKMKKQEKEFKKKISQKEMSKAAAQKKLEKLQDDHDEAMAKMKDDLEAMKDQNKRDLENRMSEMEKRTKQETVEGRGIIARMRNGFRSALGGAVDLISSPFEGIEDWFRS